jgi:hypothetical protein
MCISYHIFYCVQSLVCDPYHTPEKHRTRMPADVVTIFGLILSAYTMA